MRQLRDIDSTDRSLLVRLSLLTGVPLLFLLFIVERFFVPAPWWVLIGANLVIAAVTVLLLWTAVRGVGALTRSLLMPGAVPPVREYSEQEALVARGQIADAVDSYQSLIVAFPDDLDARLQLGALYAGSGADPGRAERCFVEIRTKNPTARQERVLGNALIDIYRGAGRRADLKAELARFARLNQGNRAGSQARRYLRKLVEEDAGLSE